MRLTIYKKMMLGFSAIILIMFIASLYVVMALHAVTRSAKNTLTSNVQAVDMAKQLKVILYDESESAQKYLLTRDGNYLTLFIGASSEFKEKINLLQDLLYDETESGLVKEMQQVHESFFTNLLDKTNRKGLKKSFPETDINWDRINALDESLDRLINLNQLSIGDAVSIIETTTNQSARVALLLMAVTLLAAFTAAFTVTRTLTRPIQTLIRGTEQIARGEFKPVNISSNDEIALLADALNTMSDEVNKANEYRTHMIQQISHEIRTPLQAILSAYELLKDQGLGQLNGEQLDLLEDVSKGIDRLENYSSQYLDLVKIEAGQMEYRMELTDLPSLVKPLVQEARLIGIGKNVSVELSVDEVPKIMADSERISVVISNLLSNAVKYAQDGGAVWMKLGTGALGAKIIVHNSGLGISPEDITKVFYKFYQSRNAARIAVSGTGVGLALVKAYTEGHGGRVHVESTVEQGTTFTIELPASTIDAPASPQKRV